MMHKRMMHMPTLIFLNRNGRGITLEIAFKGKLPCNQVIYKQTTTGQISDLRYLFDYR